MVFINKKRAFSLVEVVIALAVVTVALIAIFGLLDTALRIKAVSTRQTVLTTMTTQILSEMRSVPFSALWSATLWTGTPLAPAINPEPLSATPPATLYYFNAEGLQVTTADPATDSTTVDECIVTKIPDTTTQVPNATNKGPYQLLKLTLTFSWPVAANRTTPASRPGQQIIYATIARY